MIVKNCRQFVSLLWCLNMRHTGEDCYGTSRRAVDAMRDGIVMCTCYF